MVRLFSQIWLRQWLVAALLVSMLTGCGGGGGGTGSGSGSTGSTAATGSGGATGGGQLTGQVVINLTLRGRTPVPASVTQLRFTGFSASGAVLYGPTTLPKAPVITLSGLPIQVVKLQIDFLASGVVASMDSQPLSLSGGGTQTITDPPQQAVTAVLDAVQVTPASSLVGFGTSTQLTATGMFHDGTTRDLTQLVEWTSNNPAAVSVTANGLAQGLATGSASISADFGPVVGSATVKVTGAALTGIQVTPSGASVPKGTTKQFTAIGTFNDSTAQDITADVSWSVSPGGIATVSASGLATGVGTGSCTVSAHLNGVTGSAPFTVTAAVLQSIQVTPAAYSLAKGLTKQLTATGTFSDSTTANLSSQVAWSTSPGGIATVSASGLSTALAVGTTVVTATFNGISGNMTLSVTTAVPQTIVVTPSGPSVAKGATRQLTATATFSDATTADVSDQVGWTTSPTGIATVSATGLATAVSVGTTTVTATLSGVGGSTTLQVTPAVLKSIQVTPPARNIPVGTTAQFAATGVYTDSTTQDVTGQVSWTTFPTGTATVSAVGLATGVAQGTTTVTATMPGAGSGFASLTVTPVVLQSIQVTPTNSSIPNGTSEQLTALGFFSDNTTQDITSQVSWTTSPTGIATITASGLAAGVGVGTTIVTASLNGVNGTTALSVKSVVLQSLQVSAAASSISKGTSTQLTAIGTFSDSTTQDLTTQVSWTTSPTGVATVSGSGRATGIAQGATTVTGSLNGVNGSTGLTVTAAILQSIQLAPSSPTIALGTTQQFTATGTFSDLTTQDLTSQVSWVSSQTGIATVNSSGVVSAAAGGSTSITATLNGVSASTLVRVTAATLTSLQVTPGSPSIPKGATTQLTALGTFSDSSTQDLSGQVNWTTSPAGVATVSVLGLATGVGQGSTNVVATLNGINASASFTVTAAALTAIQVTPANSSMAKGTTKQLTATGVYSDSTTQNLTGQVSWATTPLGVAAINSTGLATGVAQGTTTIKATLSGVTGSTGLTVSSATLTSLQITPANPSMPKGAIIQLSATGTFSDNTTQNLSSQVSWTSSPTGIVSIDASGAATGVTGGSTTVTASLNAVNASTTVTVSSATLSSIQITPASSSFAKGTTKQLTATGVLSDNTTQDLTNQVHWFTSPLGIATVNPSGLATANLQGTTTVTASLSGVVGTTPLTVTAATLQSIQVTPANPSMAKGTTKQLTATGSYSDNTTQNLTSQVSWTASPTGIATVDANGSATAVTPGSTTVTATLNGVSGSTGITVTASALQSIQVTHPGSSTLPRGTTVQLTATGTFTDGTTQDLTTQVSWTTSPTGHVTVDANGLATAVSFGDTTVSATLSGVSGSTILGVSIATLQSIAVTPATPTVAIGSSLQLKAVGTYSDGTTQTLTSAVSWTTSPTGFATVGTSGLASGIATGSTTVTATKGTISGSVTLNVVNATLQSIIVKPANKSLANGFSMQLTAMGTYSDFSTQDLTSQVSWTTSPTGIATVNGSGLATGVAAGTTTVKATMSGVSGSTSLTVTSATLSSIAVTPGGATMGTGTNVQLTATGTFSDSSTQDLSTQVSWTTSASPTVDVDPSGLATPHLPRTTGATTVTATLGAKSGTATVTVTNALLQSIAVTPGSLSIVGGNVAQLKATGTFNDSTTQDLTNQVTWSSSNTGKATVNSTGLVMGVLGGSATITATLNTVSNTATVTVANPPAAVWATRVAANSNNPSLYRAAFGNGTFLAVGFASSTPSGTLFTSSDGHIWSGVNPGTTSTLLGAAFGNSTYVLVGAGGAIVSSANASSWTARTSNTTNSLIGVVYGTSGFVAVGNSGTIVSSTDGTAWTTRTSGTTNKLASVGFGGGTYVAVGASGTIRSSTDGTTWTTRTSGTANNLSGVTFASGQFVAVGDSGTILTSSDGASWAVQSSGSSSLLQDVTFGNNTFVAVGQSGVILTSPDAVTWTARNSGTGNFLLGVTFGTGTFVAVGQNGIIISSP